jgi:sporadic carbohydrate cluster 2OG-Fe(II) oxygenase
MLELEDQLIMDIPVTEHGFACSKEHDIASRYMRAGYVIEPVMNRESLDQIQRFVAQRAMQYLGKPLSTQYTHFLNNTHKYVSAKQLNSLRVNVISALMGQKNFRQHVYHIAKELLDKIVGNELVMQRGIGLSVQLPQDSSSLLNVHSDTWSGDSPFEVVVWTPLVDCFKTKTMFICTPERSAEVNHNFSRYQKLNNAEFIRELEPDLTFLDVPFGSVLIFNQNQLHGNVVNGESETRWSMNCRFKSAFSPYCDKKLGEFFEPINLKPATKIGLAYDYPNVKKEGEI